MFVRGELHPFTEQVLGEALAQMELGHLMNTYKSAIHDCPIKGPNPMVVAARKGWRYCPFCGEKLVKDVS